MSDNGTLANKKTIRRYLTVGVASCVLLIGGVGGLAAVTEFSGAVIATGTLVVNSDVKKVQHPTGGVVSEIKVREGDAVRAGDVLIRLDDTVTRANLAIVAKGLDEFEARLARLVAERDGNEEITFPDVLESENRGSNSCPQCIGRKISVRISPRRPHRTKIAAQ